MITPPRPPAGSAWTPTDAEALAEFRRFNYEHVYLRPASPAQADAVIDAATGPRRALCRPAARHPPATARAAVDVDVDHLAAGSADALRAAVAYVAGMTDRFACQQGVVQLNWDTAKLPQGVGL